MKNKIKPVTLKGLQTGKNIGKQENIHTLILDNEVFPFQNEENHKLPSIRTLAERFNSSPATVAKIIKEMVQQKILISRERSGVFINPLGPFSDILERNPLIGFVAPGLNYFNDELLKTLNEQSLKKGYITVSDNPDWLYDQIPDIVEELNTRFGVSAFLAQSLIFSRLPKKTAEFLLSPGVPIVYLFCEGFPEISQSIVRRETHGFQLAFDLLRSRNHLNTTFISDNPPNERINSFKKILTKESDFSYLESPTFRPQPIESIGPTLLERIHNKQVNAVFCHSDFYARAIRDYLRFYQVDVPREVSIIGFDGVDFPQDKEKLTSIAVSKTEVSNLALDCLFSNEKINYPLYVDPYLRMGNT